MKKTDMITLLKKREKELWLELAEYDYNNKPVFGDMMKSMEWDAKDAGRKVISHCWCELKTIMEAMGIEADLNETACELNGKVWKREKEARKLKNINPLTSL